MNRISILLICMAATSFAGPPLGCVQFVTAPGSLFSRVAPLAQVMIESDDSEAKGRVAQARMSELRARALSEPRNLEAQLEAGYLIQAMNQISKRKDADGLKFLLRALELDRTNAELHLILALAYRGEDETKSRLHSAEAQRLMTPGSPAEKNFVQVKSHLGIDGSRQD